MFPQNAEIRSSVIPASRWRLFGQSLLERNIRLLRQSGVKRIYLDLNDSDMQFFEKEVRRHVAHLSGIEIVPGKSNMSEYLLVPVNQFMLFSAFSAPDKNFILKNGILEPVTREDQHEVSDDDDFTALRKLAIEVIRTGSGGKIAQNINKRVSIPMSLLLARMRVIPNVITFVNFLLGVLSIYLITTGGHAGQAAGGILVQACSIIDGCDGEVARMTTRFSKLGGLFDTLSDQLLAVALILTALSKVYINYSPLVFTLTMAGLVGGVAIMFGIIIYFMRRYSESMSFASYNREFIDILPQDDYLARAMRYLQYLTRKELYSMFVCVFCLFNAIHAYAVAFAVIIAVGVLLMLILAFRFFPGMKRVER